MTQFKLAFISIFILTAALLCPAQNRGDRSLTVVFKDGHQKTYSIPNGSRLDFHNNTMMVTSGGKVDNIALNDIVRIDFSNAAASAAPFGRNHFIGKWEFGTGFGNDTFFVTLNRDGTARKSLGSSHGTWTVVNGEAVIRWDDGWTDIIKKVGDKHEKFAYERGKPLDGEPSNVAQAKTLNSEPI
jgi:hypothetical protein